ncbi:chain-length determining protein [Neptunomonas qingdaonensis]|uniref:Capsular polysaccharide transport system permease protein n=1 Tax=Neptunomonas qingdaonensis TaxID=1045558 RepID=A0A1I2PZC3_9GAMM|nr:chain-length determining protein [Neptunomonas qingdaonensis]SFG19357.1 capsular polysaccharide transport system permease protein [Neptunomonas qingdaonensis]
MKKLMSKNPVWLICTITVFVVTCYWMLFASDRYISQTNIVLESPQISAPTLNVRNILSGSGGHGDMLLLRDYLLSVDMLKKVQVNNDFREHFSNKKIDFLSRLADQNVSLEELHQYYLKQISVELDEYANVLRIKVNAFTPMVANGIANFLLSEGERHMNAMGQRLAAEQVNFLEAQVVALSENFEKARQALLDYQNKYGLISPTDTVESLSAVVAGLEGQLSNLQSNRTALVSYQSRKSPDVVKMDSQIAAIKTQIAIERARMAQQSGDALNVKSADYQSLELKMQFAKESYSGALAALENTRIEAARKLKQISVLQSPTFPEYPVEPRRIYNSVTFGLIAIFLSLIVQMIMLIIKDHRD